MVGSVLVLIIVVILVLGFVGAIMFFDLTLGGGHRVVADREQADNRWRPPYLRGAELRNWTRVMAERLVALVVAGGQDAGTSHKLLTKLTDGASRAMLPTTSHLEAAREVACPEAGQGVVGVSAPEAIELADYLRRTLSKAEVQRVRELSKANADLIGEDPRLLASSGSPCSLQGEDCVCKAYAARPFACRPLHATTIAHELGLDAEAGEEASVGWAAHTDAIREGIAEGLARGLEAVGLDGHVYELHGALVTAMDNPDAAERWAKGEDVFHGCRLYQPEADQGPALVT